MEPRLRSPDEKFQEVIIALKHSHLPKAAEAEYIEFDPASNFVEISGSPPEFKAILHVAEAIEHSGREDITNLL